MLLLMASNPSRAAESWACAGYTLAEYLIPGLGYGLMGDFDKMLIFGGLRWGASIKYYSYSQSPSYQEDIEEIYKETKLKTIRPGRTYILPKKPSTGDLSQASTAI